MVDFPISQAGFSLSDVNNNAEVEKKLIIKKQFDQPSYLKLISYLLKKNEYLDSRLKHPTAFSNSCG